MTTAEEIEELKAQIVHTTGEKDEAELIIALLKKTSSADIISSKSYIDRLLRLAEKLESNPYKAWGLHYLALTKEQAEDYEGSISLSQQALDLFSELNIMAGVSSCSNNIGIICYYQGNYPEALKYFLNSIRVTEALDDKKRMSQLYNNIGLIYENMGNHAEAVKSYFASLKMDEELGDERGIAISYHNIGNVYFREGNYAEALKNQFTGLQINEKIGNKAGIAACSSGLGNIYDMLGNYPEALNRHFTSLKFNKETSDEWGAAYSYNNIGNVYERQGIFTDALKYYFISLNIQLRIGNKHGIAGAYNNIGKVYFKTGRHTESLDNNYASLKISEEIEDKLGIASGHISIGLVYQVQENYTQGLDHFFTALNIYEQTGMKSGVAVACNNIGNIFAKQGNYKEALQQIFKAFEIVSESGHKELIKEATLSLSNTCKATGDFENALKYHEKYHAVESEILGEGAQKQLTNLSFMHNLEQKEKDLEIEQLRNVELKKERDRSESLLLNILPAEVAEELKEKGSAGAKLFDDVTVLFTDFKDFTKVSERLTPQQLVDELHTCFSAFDHICVKYNIEKIKTVGDAYLAVSGLPIANPKHAEDLLKAAMEIRDFISERAKVMGGNGFQVRIGVHSGSVVAGIVGVKKFAYDIWGDTVNTAARMEQNSEAGRINISHTTYELVKGKFNFEYRGEIEAKNKGKLKMYFLS